MYHFITNATTTCEQTYIYRRFDLFLVIFANDFSVVDTGKELLTDFNIKSKFFEVLMAAVSIPHGFC